MTEPFEVITVDTDRVACDGGGGALGHPKVYLNLGARDMSSVPTAAGSTSCAKAHIPPTHTKGTAP